MKDSEMTEEIAQRLKPIFKKDFKKARFSAACCVNIYAQPHQRFKNKATERRYNRKCLLFDITKMLYIECLEALGERTH